eukprot:CAMPEP_0173166130 /NCGR_PEP_ID=MMETSP1105-20130129/21823_1 /TAXON_ID=2985 /ORGANISM="Ochromonas sp., Strain BG-1" /LENGTH=871 /DNA_ID=CAMNT_0014087299 /DNA_START=251 /DNA_END=2866 /DNA_ORIENTATION=-
MTFSTSPVKIVTPPPLFNVDSTTTSQSVPTSVRQERDVFNNIFTQTSLNSSESVPVLKLYGQRELNWYTGKPPVHGVCPGVTKEGYIQSLPQVTAATTSGKWSKIALQDYFDNTWTMTEVLLGSLQGEEAFIRSPYHELRHPMIFYYGHPAVLYINKLRVAGFIKDPINPYFESVFETGVDEMSWDDLSKNKMAWPSVAEVQQYRAKVYETVTNVIANLTDEHLSSTGPESPLWSILMGFEHERIHIETSSVLINELPVKYVQFPKGMPPYHPSVPKNGSPLEPVPGKDYPVNEMIEIEGRTVAVGKDKNLPSFGWDNEYGYREFTIPSFRASKFKISNGEYLEFVKDNGYARQEFWSEDGWKWRAFRNVKWPTFWMRKGPQGHHEYDLRLMFDVVPMPWDWPVSVNYHEASAFAKWKTLKSGSSQKYRILTELEHRAIRDEVKEGKTGGLLEDHAAIYGGDKAQEAGYNINLAYSSMTPVNSFSPNSKGFHDVFGNAWEWMEDYFCALPGFEIHPYYEDFSTPCFDGLHNVIQGGSFISTGDEASIHSRFHFRPHFFQHSSFRLVEQLPGTELVTSDTDAPGPFVGNYPYRRSKEKLMEAVNNHADGHKSGANHALALPQALSKHFGVPASSTTSLLNLENPLQPLSRLISSFVDREGVIGGRVVEVGCGVGGLSFELLEKFQTVIGIDHNMEFINTAKALQRGEEVSYHLSTEGELGTTQVFSLAKSGKADHNLADNKAKQMEFRCADPMCLPAEMNGFDCVILNDVIDQMSSPNALLGRLSGVRGLVRPGGVLVVISAFQWSEERTPKSLWLGGVKGSDVTSVDALSKRLATDSFVEKLQTKVPILWNETMADVRGKIYHVIAYKRMN